MDGPATKLKRVLLAREMTQVELAQRSGVSRFAVYRAYYGHSRMSLETWARLARALDVTVRDIASDEELADLAELV